MTSLTAIVLFVVISKSVVNLQPSFCDPPPDVENGNYLCDRKLKWGSVCKYHCSPRYRLLPSNHTGLLCYKNSTWIGSRLPVCQLDFCAGSATIDLVIAMDASESINYANWREMKNFINVIARSYYLGSEGMQIGVFQFKGDVITRNQILLNRFSNNNKQEFEQAMKSFTYQKISRGTDISKALRYAKENLFTRDNGDRPEARNVLLVMTDGVVYQDSDIQQLPAVAEDLRDSGIKILVVGIFPLYATLNHRTLIEIAGGPENVMYLTSGFEHLVKDFMDKFGNILCPEL